MKKFMSLLLVLCNVMVSSFFVSNTFADTTETVVPKADANGQYTTNLVHNNVECNVTFNGFVGFLDVELPIATVNEFGAYVVKNEKTKVPVLRMTANNAIEIKITKGGDKVKTATAYPAVYTYNSINSTDYAFVDAGQIGLATGNAQSAHLMYNVGGLTNGNIQYYDEKGGELFTLGYDYVLVLDTAMEKSFLETGKLSATNSFGWPGLKKLLEDNPTDLTSEETVNTKEEILKNMLKNANKG